MYPVCIAVSSRVKRGYRVKRRVYVGSTLLGTERALSKQLLLVLAVSTGAVKEWGPGHGHPALWDVLCDPRTALTPL